MLGRAAVAPESIDGWGVTLGPGSFTGLRVGMAAVKALALSHGRQAYGISTLEAMAWSALEHPAPLCPVLDARRNRIYAALFEVDAGRPVRVGREVDADPLEFLSSLERAVTLFGPGAAAYRSVVEAAAPAGSRVVEGPPSLAPTVAQLALAAFEEGRGVEPGALVPCYVRPPDARLPG
jgi:tRNA threonylcarbamoyladenosine biosynthesis protein TsaB